MTTKRPIDMTGDELQEHNLNIDPRAFANEILDACKRLGFIKFTHLSFQEWLYYCYAVSVCGIKKFPFLPIDNNRNMNIDFWKFGPVCVPVYNEFKNFKNRPLVQTLDDYDKIEIDDDTEIDDNFNIIYKKCIMPESEYKNSIVNAIYQVLIGLSEHRSSELVDKTHSLNSAWTQFFSNNQEKANPQILECIMNEAQHYGYFMDLWKENFSKFND